MPKPRIPPVSSPAADAAEILVRMPTLEGRPLNIFSTFAHHPLLLKRYAALGGVFLGSNLLPDREREIVILRVAWLTGSVYEFGHHTRAGLAAGLSEEEIARVAHPGDEGWAPPDALLLRAVEELKDADRVGDATWTKLAKRWSEAELLELVALVGFYRMTAGLLNSAGVEPDEGVAGWPPGTRPGA